ncbi:MAG: dihydroorotase, partial [Thioalkalispiraceae bacterium]
HDVYIVDGRIASLEKAPKGFKADETIDAQGQIIMPGIVDLCARLREPGQEHKGTIASETRAAAASGVTTLCVPPDTQPIIDNPAVAELIQRRAEQAGFANVVTLGALTLGLQGEQLSEMDELRIEGGCVGVSNGTRYIGNTLIMRRAMEYAASCGLTVFITPEEHSLVNGGVAHEGSISSRLGLPGIPEAAETVAVARELMLIEQTGVRAHFCRLSTGRAIQMIARAQHDGLPVTADVAAHQLHLTEMDLGYFNSQCHVRPPLRTQRDMECLHHALQSGNITAVCSDHQPHDADAKLAPFSETEPGISALETLLPLTWRLVDEGLLTPIEAIARLTQHPARILGLDKGQLAEGAVADICIFDAEQHWSVNAEQLVSQGKNTPLDGWELKGRVTYTLLNGKTVFALNA